MKAFVITFIFILLIEVNCRSGGSRGRGSSIGSASRGITNRGGISNTNGINNINNGNSKPVTTNTNTNINRPPTNPTRTNTNSGIVTAPTPITSSFPSQNTSDLVDNQNDSVCNYTDIKACIADLKCVWCDDEECVEGNDSGPKNDECKTWVNHCSSRDSCSMCVSSSDCHWCPSSGKCLLSSNYNCSSALIQVCPVSAAAGLTKNKSNIIPFIIVGVTIVVVIVVVVAIVVIRKRKSRAKDESTRERFVDADGVERVGYEQYF